MGTFSKTRSNAALHLLVKGMTCTALLSLGLLPSCNGLRFAPSPEAAVVTSDISTHAVSSAYLEDTWINSAAPAATNGGSQYLTVTQPDGSSQILLRFDADEIRGRLLDHYFLSARIRLYSAACSAKLTANGVAAGSALWNENASWNCEVQGGSSCTQSWSVPRIGGAFGGDGDQTGGPAWLELDVTAEVAALLGETGSHEGFLITSNGVLANTDFVSSESTDTAHHPELVLEYVEGDYAPSEPADTGPLAPPFLDVSTPTHTYDAMSWLLEPARGLQWGFSPGIFDPDRAAVVRGRVVGRDNITGGSEPDPIAGVEVSVLHHPEFGRTRTRVATGSTNPTGFYELMVNGGETYTFTFRREGYLTAQRQITVPWNGWLALPDVALVPDTALEGGNWNGNRVIYGPTYSSPDTRGGVRSMRIYVPTDTTVTGEEFGTGQATFSVRMAEYTRTPTGGTSVDPASAMPAELPPTTSYTYAAEAEVSVGTTVVTRPVFNQPVYLYVRTDGFLSGTGFGAGSPVPYGSYDGSRGGWSPETNGAFVTIDSTGSTTNCMPGIDLGDEEIDICQEPDTGVTAFAPGTYMRVPVNHFSFIDLNWLLGLFTEMPEDSAEGPDPNQVCEAPGSILYCESQVLGERWPISGTPHALMYLSDRHEGRREDYRVRVRPFAVLPSMVEDYPARARVELYVAGQRVASAVATAVVSATEVVLEWSGEDAYERRLVGPQRADVRIGYEYARQYQATIGTASFGTVIPPETEASLGTGDTVIAWRRRSLTVGNIDDLISGLAGLGIDAHHFYDPATGTLIMGDGHRRTAESVSATMDPAPYADPSFARGTSNMRIGGLTVGPDGTVYYFDDGDNRIYYRRRGDSAATVLNAATTYNFVHGLSVGTYVSRVGSSDVVEQVLYVSDTAANMVYRVSLGDPAHPRTSVLGTGGAGFTVGVSPGSPLTIAGPSSFVTESPYDVAAAPDGSVYVLLYGTASGRIVRYRERASGTGVVRQVEVIRDQLDTYLANYDGSLTLAGDGTLYYTVDGAGMIPEIRRIRPDGRDEFVAGNPPGPPVLEDGAEACPATGCASIGDPTGLTVSPSGELCFGSRPRGTTTALHRVRCLRREDDGRSRVYTVAGVRWVDPSGDVSTSSFQDALQVWHRVICPPSPAPRPAWCNDGTPATRTRIDAVQRIAWSPDGRLFVGDFEDIRVVAPTLDGSLTQSHLVASEDGSEIYEFTAGGRHTRTIDAITGTCLASRIVEHIC